MKGDDFVKNAANIRFFSHKSLFRAAGILLVLTLLSVCMVCGLFAKYTSRGQSSQSARVALMSGVTIAEHEAIAVTDLSSMIGINSTYTLNTDSTVSSNTYYAVPGTSIPKDPFITLDGSNETACELYIEVVDGSSGCAKFDISDDWTEDNEFSPRHSGTVYKYKSEIAPKTSTTINNIIKSNNIRITESYSDITQKNAGSFSIDFYAYLVQKD
jgi:hypothetical protein